MSDQSACILGLGIIGSRACSRLADAGWRVTCWNRTPKGAAGEKSTPEDAVAGANFISIYLKDAPAVREIAARLRPVLRSGQVVMNHATLDLETTLWLRDLCQSCGCEFLDAPFTGSKIASADGQLVYYIGGDPALAAKVDSFLAVTSKRRLPCGDVGSATVVKLATNLISACTVQALAESLAIATRNGVTAECLAEAVSLNASSSMLTSMKLGAMVSADYEPHFSLSNMGKDARYMVALAESVGLQTPAIAAVSQRMNELADSGLGELDFSAVAKPYQSGT